MTDMSTQVFGAMQLQFEDSETGEGLDWNPSETSSRFLFGRESLSGDTPGSHAIVTFIETSPEEARRNQLANRRIYKWIPYVEERLRQIASRSSLPGYPHRETIGMVSQYIAWLLPPSTPAPSVVPSGDGGIRLIWHKGSWDIDVEVSEEDRSFWAEDTTTGEIHEGDLNRDEETRVLQDILGLIK